MGAPRRTTPTTDREHRARERCARRWEFSADPLLALASSYPKNIPAAYREIIARSADPTKPITRLRHERSGYQLASAEEIERGIAARHTLLIVARPDFLPVDFDGVPLDDVYRFDEELAGEGLRSIIYTSGGVYPVDGQVLKGYHLLSHVTDPRMKEHYSELAKRKYGGDPRVNSAIRFAGAPYKVLVSTAYGEVAEHTQWIRSASRKRARDRHLTTHPELLWPTVDFLRAAEPPDGVLFNPFRRMPTRSARTRIRAAPACQPAGAQRRAPAELLDLLDPYTRRLLVEGDFEGRFPHRKEKRTDRSKLSLSVVGRLRRDGLTAPEVETLIPTCEGLARYRGRYGRERDNDPWGLDQLHRDWNLTDRQLALRIARPRRRGRALEAALRDPRMKAEHLLVYAELAAVKGRLAPSYRTLCEWTGYKSTESISMYIHEIIKLGRLRKVGPIRGRNDFEAQEFELLVLPEESNSWSKHTGFSPPPEAPTRIESALQRLQRIGVPLRHLVRGLSPPGELDRQHALDVLRLLDDGSISIETILLRLGQKRVLRAKRWTAAMRARHWNERVAHWLALQSASDTPFEIRERIRRIGLDIVPQYHAAA